MTICLMLAWAQVALTVPQTTELVAATNAVVVPLPTGAAAIQFDVVNRTNQAVTAWKVAVEFILSDGKTGRRAVTADAYAAYAGLVPDHGSGGIPAGGSFRWLVPVENPTDTGVLTVRAALAWAVFADGTWIGDPAGAQDAFRGRDREQRALGVIIASLRAGYAAGAGPEGLRVALDHLNKRDQTDYDHLLKQTMRQNLEMALKRGQPSPVSPDEFLRTWILMMEARWKAADEHRRPKFPPPAK